MLFRSPMRVMLSPLNRHPHFSNSLSEARGKPWKNPNYRGEMRNIVYEDLNLPVTYEYCYGRIIELYAHPGIEMKHLEFFGRKLREFYERFGRQTPRNLWNFN